MISRIRWVGEQFLNGTSAHKRPFSALNVLCKNNYVEKIKILPDFIPIQFKTTEPLSFLKGVAPTRSKTSR